MPIMSLFEDRCIMSVKYYLPVPVFHFWPKLTHSAAWSVCDSRATCLLWTSSGDPATIYLRFGPTLNLKNSSLP